jgi:hypothetical protein
MIYRNERQTICLLASLGELVIVGSDSSTPWGPAFNASVGTETALRESFPKRTVVLTAGEDLVGLDDGVTSLEERRPARLQLHAIEDELSNEGVSVLGNERLGGTVDLVFAGAVEVTGRDGAILFGQRREEGIRELVLLDEFLGDNPEDLSPDLTNGVHTPVTRLVEGLVRRGVDGDVLEMRVR